MTAAELPLPFDDLSPPAPAAEAAPPTVPLARAHQRLHTAERQQVELIARSLDQLIADDHPVRLVWRWVERLDLAAFYTPIRAAIDGPGRPATDPQVLLALWLYATIDGVGSARRLARLCVEHDAYRWLRGRAPVNYHLLSDFRIGHRETLDDLLTQTLAALLSHGLITLETVAQDGIRVRAAAGNSSFRRRATLERCREQAAQRVQELARETETPDPEGTRRQRAARERAARDRQDRLDQAFAELPRLEAIKEKQRRRASAKDKAKIQEARVSTTDPEAQMLRMGDGGFRPGYNVQQVTDGATRAVLAVQVTNAGSDGGLAKELEAQVARRCGGRHPRTYLIDGGLTDAGTIDVLTARQVTVYGPLPPTKGGPTGRAPGEARADDSAAVAAWRARMASDAGKATYTQRGELAEWTHAQWRAKFGLQQFRVRGIAKVTSVMLLIAVAHNLLQWDRLGV